MAMVFFGQVFVSLNVSKHMFYSYSSEIRLQTLTSIYFSLLFNRRSFCQGYSISVLEVQNHRADKFRGSKVFSWVIGKFTKGKNFLVLGGRTDETFEKREDHRNRFFSQILLFSGPAH